MISHSLVAVRRVSTQCTKLEFWGKINSFAIFEYLPLNFMPLLPTLCNMLKLDCSLGIEIFIVNKLLKQNKPMGSYIRNLNAVGIANAVLYFTLT